METLRSAGYLAQKYDASYNLLGRPAEYYLRPLAIPPLRSTTPPPGPRELKQVYARRQASLRFIDRSLAIFDIYLCLRRLYGDRLRLITTPQLNVELFDYLPRPLPDAFMNLDPKTSCERHFFVEYFDDGVSIGIHGRKIRNYLAYFESGEWDDTGSYFPTVMIVCESIAMRRRAEKRVRYLERQHLSDISFRIIDIAALREIETIRKKSWSDPIEKSIVTL